MKLGVAYPQTELGGDPIAVRRFAEAVEGLGFDYLLAYDHVLGAVHGGRTPRLTGPYTEHDPFHDPLVMFAFLAGLTQRIGFATGVLILPQRQTALVARQAADIDLLSGGRLRLGVGVGWSPVEYEALGEDFRTRGARQEEQMELLRRLFNDPVVDFSGRFHRIDRASLIPKPAHHIPIWLGGSSEPAFRRAARLGDGFVFSGSTIDDVTIAWHRLLGLVDAQGRPAQSFGGEYIAPPWAEIGTLVADFDAWQRAGGTHACVVTMGRGLDTVEEHIDLLTELAEALVRPDALVVLP